jgi:hypothetical protein
MKGTESAPATGMSFTKLVMMVSPISTLPSRTAPCNVCQFEQAVVGVQIHFQPTGNQLFGKGCRFWP